MSVTDANSKQWLASVTDVILSEIAQMYEEYLYSMHLLHFCPETILPLTDLLAGNFTVYLTPERDKAELLKGCVGVFMSNMYKL